jgi:hypothetical protein
VEDNYQGQRLLAASTAAFAVLADLGFQVAADNANSWRGAEVSVRSATVTIVIQAEWWDRELAVWIDVEGAPTVAIEDLVPDIKGILRLPRRATRGVLQRRLDRIVRALQRRVREVLIGGEQAVRRVLEAISAHG